MGWYIVPQAHVTSSLTRVVLAVDRLKGEYDQELQALDQEEQAVVQEINRQADEARVVIVEKTVGTGKRL